MTSTKQYVTRKYVSLVNLASGASTVTGQSVNLPDGCKVLKVVAKNLTGRYLRLEVPQDTCLMVPPAEGDSTAPFGGIKKHVSSPWTRFPTLKVNVPDLLAAPVNNALATDVMFLLSGGTTDAVELSFTVRYTL